MTASGPGPIVVAGAGIGGLTVALAFAGRGRQVQVFECRESLGDVGAAITLWPNALTALAKIGVGAIIGDVGSPITSGGIRKSDGSWIRRFDGRRLRAALGEEPVVVGRGELLHVLASTLGLSQIRFGVGVDSYRLRPDVAGVEVVLADGTHVSAVGLVGADGVLSAVSHQLHAGLSSTYAGYTAWRGVAMTDIGEFAPGETWGPGGEFGYLPMKGNRTYWFATENTSEGASAPVNEREYLLGRFRGWHDPITQLIAATDPGAVLRHDIYDRKFLARWSDGPVVLVGDAAHPMRPHLGQGGCQAIEDGVLLAAAADGRADLAEAFNRFAGERRRRVRRIVRESALIGRVIQGDGTVATLARQVVRLVPEAVLMRHLASIGGSGAMDN